MGYAGIAGAALLLFAGGSLLLWHYNQAIQDARARADAAQVNTDLAQAYEQIGVTSCGGRPCMKLDTKSPRRGSKGEYVLLEAADHKPSK